MNAVTRYDRIVGDGGARYRNSAVMKLAGPASDIADQWPLFGLCMGTALVGLARRDRKLVGTGVEMTAAMLLATALKNAVKNRVDRTRPIVTAEGGTYLFRSGGHDVSELNSFPSGHTAGAVAVACTVERRYPALATPVRAAAASVTIAQIPRAKHYPSDLLAGLVVGMVAGGGITCGRWLSRHKFASLLHSSVEP